MRFFALHYRIVSLVFVRLLAPLPGWAADPSTGGVTFNRDVLPILQRKCQQCHRPGEAGTGSFLTYESTRPWAKAIKNEVLARRMPPWFANPEFGHFANERRLTEEEIRTLSSWVDNGAPEGDAADKPKRVKWNSGWNIQPDAVFETSRPFVVPAQGVLDYTYIVIHTNFEQDAWITAGEIRPSDRSVVHHISAFWRPPGSAWLAEAKAGVPYTLPKADARNLRLRAGPGGSPPRLLEDGAEFLIGYSPGMQAQDFSIDHAAKLIPANSDLVLQIHCTPNGKTQVEERVEVGFVFAKNEPTRRFLTVSNWDWDISIPPGANNLEGHASMRFNETVSLIFLQPHMHLRGKDMTVRLVYPDGRSQVLLDVPHYRFDWQIVYYEAQPLQIPKGSRLEVTAHWDNSSNNPLNPDPQAHVYYGPQSTDEMLACQTGFTVDRHASLSNVVTIESGRYRDTDSSAE